MKFLTVDEVVANSPAENASKALCNQINICIEEIFRECFGLDFLDDLKNDLIDYSLLDAYKGEWNEDADYIEKDIVLYCGRYYTYKGSQAGTRGVEYPDCSNEWCIELKFNSECYNTLWDNYMAEYLSTAIYLKAIPFIHMKSRSNGFMIQESDGIGGKAMDRTWYNTYRKEVLDLCERLLKNLKAFMQSCDENCDFSNVLFLNNLCGSDNCKGETSGIDRFNFLY